MALANSFRAYFAIRPAGFIDGLRLFRAYLTSVVLRFASPSRFQSVGLVVRGSRNLHVLVDQIEFEVRPGTNDLDLLSANHEPMTTQWFQVRADEVVVDVGAHIGRYTLMAASRGASVIAIEPAPSNFQLLEKNVKLNRRSNVVLLPEAMTSSPGRLLLSVAPASNTGTSSVVPGKNPSTEGREIRVRGDTLDNVVKSHGLNRIDWLKIDVEGHEVAVLKGASSTLDITRRLILEVTDGTEEACRRLAEAHGFRLVAVEKGDPASNLLMAKNGS